MEAIVQERNRCPVTSGLGRLESYVERVFPDWVRQIGEGFEDVVKTTRIVFMRTIQIQLEGHADAHFTEICHFRMCQDELGAQCARVDLVIRQIDHEIGSMKPFPHKLQDFKTQVIQDQKELQVLSDDQGKRCQNAILEKIGETGSWGLSVSLELNRLRASDLKICTWLNTPGMPKPLAKKGDGSKSRPPADAREERHDYFSLEKIADEYLNRPAELAAQNRFHFCSAAIL